MLKLICIHVYLASWGGGDARSVYDAHMNKPEWMHRFVLLFRHIRMSTASIFGASLGAALAYTVAAVTTSDTIASRHDPAQYL